MFSRDKKLETGLAIVFGLLIIQLITKADLLISICIIIAGVALFWSWGSDKLTYLWLKLSHALGWVMSKVILGIMFYVVLVPIAFLSRIFKKDLLSLKRNDQSYYTTRDHRYQPGDMDDPW